MSDRLRALHAVFFKGDTDASGSLCYDEFVGGIRPLVGTLDPSEERFLFSAFDFSRDGKVNLAEFDYTLFRDVQVGGDAANVKKALADLILRKLAAFRALAPGEHGNLGSAVDDNIVDLQQSKVKAEQAKGVGIGAASTRVFTSFTGIISVFCIAAVIGGIVAAVLLGKKELFIIAGVGYAVHLIAGFASRDFSLLSNPIAGTEGLVAVFNNVYRANAAYTWHIECYHYVQFVEYFSARDAWRAANTRDKHQDFSAAEAVPELQPELLVEYVPGLRPWWMAPWAFALASFTLSALCYKVAFNARCGRQEVLFVKDAVGFADDAVCEEAHMYDAEKAAEAKGGVVIVPVVVQAVAPSNGYAGEVERG